MLEESAQGIRTDINYFVVGDSTRNFTTPYTLDYYTSQLNKINITLKQTARSGLKATYWLDGTSPRVTITDTLLAIPSTNDDDFILEFSLGINDMGLGLSQSTVYNTLKNSIEALQNARPNMKILLVSPVSHTISDMPYTSNKLESIYLQLATELNLSLVSAKVALDTVHQDFVAPENHNSDFYVDRVHPNADGSRRLVNYIFSEIGGASVHNTMTVTDSATMSIADIQAGLNIQLLIE
jgi:hypothetical protein